MRERMKEYGALFERLEIIVFQKRKDEIRNPKFERNEAKFKIQIAENVWVYPTNSLSRWFYIRDAIKIGKEILSSSKANSLQLTPSSRAKLTTGQAANSCVLTTQDAFETGIVGRKLAKHFSIPLHVQIHTDFLNPYFTRGSFFNKIRVRMARRVLKDAAGIRVVSNRIKSSFLTAHGLELKASPIVVPIFADVEKIKNEPVTYDLHKRFPQFSFIILMASRLTHEKNISFALDVFKEVLEDHPKTGLVIVGEGPELHSLKRKVNSLQLQASVVFEGWRDDIISHYKTADLLLHTSSYEGYGMALLEAAAAGLPIVSSDVGIARELLNFGNHSFVCPVGDTACFVSKIIGIMNDNYLRALFRLNTVVSLKGYNHYSKEEYLEKYKEMLETVLDTHT